MVLTWDEHRFGDVGMWGQFLTWGVIYIDYAVDGNSGVGVAALQGVGGGWWRFRFRRQAGGEVPWGIGNPE